MTESKYHAAVSEPAVEPRAANGARRLARKVKDEEILEKRRHEIYQAAIEVFSAKGYHAAKIEDIAEAAGVAKGTLYEYIRNKVELFLFVLEEGMREAREELLAALNKYDGAPDKLRAFLRTQLSLIMRNGVLVNLYFQSPEVLNDDDMARVRDDNQAYFRVLAEILEQGIREGVFRDVPVGLTARMILSTSIFWATAHEELGGDSALDEIVEHMYGMLVYGVGVGGGIRS